MNHLLLLYESRFCSDVMGGLSKRAKSRRKALETGRQKLDKERQEKLATAAGEGNFYVRIRFCYFFFI